MEEIADSKVPTTKDPDNNIIDSETDNHDTRLDNANTRLIPAGNSLESEDSSEAVTSSSSSTNLTQDLKTSPDSNPAEAAASETECQGNNGNSSVEQEKTKDQHHDQVGKIFP